MIFFIYQGSSIFHRANNDTTTNNTDESTMQRIFGLFSTPDNDAEVMHEINNQIKYGVSNDVTNINSQKNRKKSSTSSTMSHSLSIPGLDIARSYTSSIMSQISDVIASVKQNFSK